MSITVSNATKVSVANSEPPEAEISFGGTAALEVPKGLVQSGGNKAGVDNSEPPEAEISFGGTAAVTIPKGLVQSGATKTTLEHGISASGEVSRGGDFVNGTVSLYSGGYEVSRQGIASTRYQISGEPNPAIRDGESTDGQMGNQVVISTERGGLATEEFSGQRVAFNINFGLLTVQVNDANGNPAEKARVVLEGLSAVETDEDGEALFETSGTVSVESLDGSVTKEATVPGGGEDTIQFNWAGLETNVKTPNGSAIANTTVQVVTNSGVVVATAETDDNGEANFLELPAQTTLYAISAPYFRTANTRGEGEVIVRSFPANTMYVGNPEAYANGNKDGYGVVSEDELTELTLNATDEVTGAPISELEVGFNEFEAATNAEGIARSIVQEAELPATLQIGSDQRYERVVKETDSAENSVVLERHVRSTQT